MGALSFTSIAKSSASVNLTSVGPVNWVTWDGTTPSFTTPNDQMSGGTGTITLSRVGAASHSGYTSDPRTFSWTNGTTLGTGSHTGGYYISAGVGSGWDIAFPADTTTRIAKVYFGHYSQDTKVTATLSDASAGPITDTTTFTGSVGIAEQGFIIVTYSANSGGQTLTIRIETNNAFSGANTAINAAALDTGAASSSAVIAWVLA